MEGTRPVRREDSGSEGSGKGQGEELAFSISAAEIGFAPKRVWCPAPSWTHRTRPYSVPKTVSIGTRDTDEAGARFSPPPYAVLVEDGPRRAFVGVSADTGWHQWNYVSFGGAWFSVVLRVVQPHPYF